MEEAAVNEGDQTQDYSNKFWEYLGLTADFLTLPLCFAAVVVNILLIFVILRYKRLRKRHNYYLVNFAIFHSIYIVSTPFLHIIIDFVSNGDVPMRIYCVFLRIENYAILVLLIFTGGYTLDAFLQRRKDKWYQRYEKFYIHIFVLAHVLGVLYYVTCAGLCYAKESEIFSFYVLTTTFSLISISLFYTFWINKDKPIIGNDSKAIKISLVIILCYLPLLICYTLLSIFKDNQKIEFYLWYSAFIPEFVAYCCSMVVTYKLYQLDKHFRVAFRRIWRRPVQDADYDELNSPDDVEVN